ncbi:MAG TPA: hypothetical protein VE978_27750 [Chitinophagales bacterium]|nr:hypothetical protein [Chitinophagales bacterium]
MENKNSAFQKPQHRGDLLEAGQCGRILFFIAALVTKMAALVKIACEATAPESPLLPQFLNHFLNQSKT